MENFEQFVIDYLNWSARQKVIDYQRLQNSLQSLHLKEQRDASIAYRQKIESFNQLKLVF